MMIDLFGAILYGNIGIKILYNNVAVAFLQAPNLHTKKGRLIWTFLVPIYWACAYVIAGSVPYFAGIVGVTSALCLIQFSYTFPAILATGFWIMETAMQPDEGFDPVTGKTIYHDRGWRRWTRGFARNRYFNTANIVYAAGCLAVAGLGLYASIESLIEAFEIPQVNAFSCTSPLDLNGS